MENMDEQQAQVQQQAVQPEQQTLNTAEVLEALNIAQAEVNRWGKVVNTLTKCAMFIDTIVRNQQAQAEQLSQNESSEPLVASPAAQQEKVSA